VSSFSPRTKVNAVTCKRKAPTGADVFDRVRRKRTRVLLAIRKTKQQLNEVNTEKRAAATTETKGENAESAWSWNDRAKQKREVLLPDCRGGAGGGGGGGGGDCEPGERTYSGSLYLGRNKKRNAHPSCSNKGTGKPPAAEMRRGEEEMRKKQRGEWEKWKIDRAREVTVNAEKSSVKLPGRLKEA